MSPRPRVLSAPEPEFSEEARRSRISGNVLVYLVIDENGLPQDVEGHPRTWTWPG